MGKEYEELGLTDDFMFGKVMEDPVRARKLLAILLQREIGELESTQTQREFKFAKDGKPVRLDLYTRDSKAIYDAEMQNRNNRGLKEMDLPRRARFYQSMMDEDFLEKGKPYWELPEGNVVMICTFDPFGLNRYAYEFNNRDLASGISLNDGTFKYFFNCTYMGEDAPEEILEFYRYIRTGEATSGFTKDLDEAVKLNRMNRKWKAEYMKELLHDDDVRREGRAEGLELANKLYAILISQNRIEDMKRATDDLDYQKELMEELLSVNQE